jgi:hypothetical protein
MYFEERVRIFGKVDVGPLKAPLLAVPETSWEKDWRRRANPNFADSHTLWMAMSPLTEDNIFHVFDSLVLCNHKEFEQEYLKIATQVEEAAKGIIVRAGIIRLPAGHEVHRHVDGKHNLMKYCHRILLPVITNPKALFHYDDGEQYFMEEGVIYDTNGYLPHRAYNGGDTSRYTFVFDIMPKDETAMTIKFYEWDKAEYIRLDRIKEKIQSNKLLPMATAILRHEANLKGQDPIL